MLYCLSRRHLSHDLSRFRNDQGGIGPGLTRWNQQAMIKVSPPGNDQAHGGISQEMVKVGSATK